MIRGHNHYVGSVESRSNTQSISSVAVSYYNIKVRRSTTVEEH